MDPAPTQAPPQAKGSTHGQGTIDTTCGEARFEFTLRRLRADGPIRGEFALYTDPGAGIRLRNKNVTSFFISGNTASFSGTCTEDGSPCQFSVQVVDNGPGESDTFSIQISGSTIPPGYSESGTLQRGNIRVNPA